MTVQRFTVLAAACVALNACATETFVPACRPPQAHEMAAFTAIVAHNESALMAAMTPGPARATVARGDPHLRAALWGAQGETRGTLISLLRSPPLCLLDDPNFAATETANQVLVYPQAAYDRVGAPPETIMPEIYTPYGVEGRDYATCRFEMVDGRWGLADFCGYGPPAATPAG